MPNLILDSSMQKCEVCNGRGPDSEYWCLTLEKRERVWNREYSETLFTSLYANSRELLLTPLESGGGPPKPLLWCAPKQGPEDEGEKLNLMESFDHAAVFGWGRRKVAGALD
ncbi:hypothetical protein AXG93_2912s1070 [Marchantia polymorpha subsp. ruderalis]|uniref:Uncharacterized protein n=1 Tax=Marchantia polymorpha subsp. ruderalis TaxID=1480154 RepID=A0A176WFU2_MARPO|nr:hypothetical protein AXG93_2912s1070 [Marchantia polymorpha subsp. ruderalis]